MSVYRVLSSRRWKRFFHVWCTPHHYQPDSCTRPDCRQRAPQAAVDEVISFRRRCCQRRWNWCVNWIVINKYIIHNLFSFESLQICNRLLDAVHWRGPQTCSIKPHSCGRMELHQKYRVNMVSRQPCLCLHLHLWQVFHVNCNWRR